MNLAKQLNGSSEVLFVVKPRSTVLDGDLDPPSQRGKESRFDAAMPNYFDHLLLIVCLGKYRPRWNDNWSAAGNAQIVNLMATFESGTLLSCLRLIVTIALY